MTNKLCGKPIKCSECKEYTGYAGDDCDYISEKYSRQHKRFVWSFVCLPFVVYIIIQMVYILCK